MLINRGPLPRRGVLLSDWFNQQQTVDDKLMELEQIKRELDCDYSLENAARFHELFDELQQDVLDLTYKSNYRFELRVEAEG